MAKKAKKRELIDHPKHYGGRDNPYEVIKVIEAWGLDRDFLLGNTIKYIGRLGNKDLELQELKKAAWYLKRKIENLEKANGRKQISKTRTRSGSRVRKASRLHGERPVSRPRGKGVVRRGLANRRGRGKG